MQTITRWEQAEGKLAGIAEAFPEERFEWKLVEGVRTFGDVLRHVAFWNQYVADTARGKKAKEEANELPKAKYATKARVVEALKKSAGEAAAALKGHGALDAKMAEMVMAFIEHTSEHYGQLAVYARMGGWCRRRRDKFRRADRSRYRSRFRDFGPPAFWKLQARSRSRGYR